MEFLLVLSPSQAKVVALYRMPWSRHIHFPRLHNVSTEVKILWAHCKIWFKKNFLSNLRLDKSQVWVTPFMVNYYPSYRKNILHKEMLNVYCSQKFVGFHWCMNLWSATLFGYNWFPSFCCFSIALTSCFVCFILLVNLTGSNTKLEPNLPWFVFIVSCNIVRNRYNDTYLVHVYVKRFLL